MPDDLFRVLLLVPALVATLPGLWLCYRKRYGWGAGLAIVGAVVIGLVAQVAILVGFVSGRAFPVALVIWSSVALYCVVAIGFALALGPKRPANTERMQ